MVDSSLEEDLDVELKEGIPIRSIDQRWLMELRTSLFNFERFFPGSNQNRWTT